MKLCARITINQPFLRLLVLVLAINVFFFFTLSMHKCDKPFNELHPNVFIHFVSVSYELWHFLIYPN